MSGARPLIVLDRDGVLNRMVVNPDHGTVDSPLHPSQVELLPGVPEALKKLCEAGYSLAVATNQPAAARAKTTYENLQAVHAKIMDLAQSAGGRISSSHICLHVPQDACACRKPKPGLLEEALRQDSRYERAWMVGDGITDVEAGVAAGFRTAFLGPKKCDHCKIFESARLTPDFWGASLPDFVDHLLKK